MGEYTKQLPPELRSKSSVAAADVHRDLSNSLAEPSGRSFRSHEAPSKERPSRLDQQFLAFSEGQGELAMSSGNVTRSAAAISASSWTLEDLQPRSSDGAEVLNFLSSDDAPENLNEDLETIASRRGQRWQMDADQSLPDCAALSESDSYPYLTNLLSLPEFQSMAVYLHLNSYTDDVWSLPMTLKQDLDCVKSMNTSNSEREKALRRLKMLGNHLGIKSSMTGEKSAIPGRAGFTNHDWETIWHAQQ
ncbi:MAG: hypothetical protein CYPHOPRED_001256 [Cyphobasidiales sp. Tagirdzhanova-0007]|nr:MAG: hypothetical protein CYPHOPRED_001256 [Cyphobasidiales sp. Tagirdzhanova-0007]